jgi:hypothetical protein
MSPRAVRRSSTFHTPVLLVVGHDGVWITAFDAILDHYLATTPAPAP